MSAPQESSSSPAEIAHGVSRLPSVVVEAYNVEVKDGDGFVGDRASNHAFREIIERGRERLRKGRRRSTRRNADLGTQQEKAR